MTCIKLGGVRAFPDAQPTKERAVKVIEEASEVHGAWQMLESTRENMHDMLAEHGWDESCANEVIECMHDAKYCRPESSMSWQTQRKCRECGAEFAPRFARQARCDACIRSMRAGKDGRDEG